MNDAPVIAAFRPTEHLAGVLTLCRAEGWSSYPDHPERAARALTAPGVLCLVALDKDNVVGAVQVQTDGAIQAHLSLLVVARQARGLGIGRRLVAEALAQSGAQRMDSLAEPDAAPFYERLPHKRMPGYRLYLQS